MSTVADPGSRGANSRGGHQHTILPNFSKNCMKSKEFGPLEGMRVPCATLRSAETCHLPIFPVYHCRCRNPKCRVFLSDWQVKVRPISGGFLPYWSLRVEKDCMLRQSFLSPIWQRVYMCVIGSAVCNTLAGPNYTFSTVDIRKLFSKICYELRRFIARRARPMYFTKSFQKCLDFSPKNPSNLNLDL